MARRFPSLTRYRQDTGTALLLTAEIERARCFVKLERNEREVIAFNPRRVSAEPLALRPKED